MTEQDPHAELEKLVERRWDIMDELNLVEIAISALLNKIRGQDGN